MFLILSFLGGFFICSSSSIFSALILIASTIVVLMMMYWNMIISIPLYIFSLFMLGGLYVLIGFVMMASMKDLDMMVGGSKMKENLTSFLSIFLGFNFSGMIDKFDLELISICFSPIKMNDWSSSGSISSVYIFLILILLIYLFIIHPMMKSSTSGGGFIS